MTLNETCEHYCGDEDCAKCDIYGILIGGCGGCKKYDDSVRDCDSCKHYKKKQQLGNINIWGCSKWECEYEPKDNGEEERMSIWAN